VPGRPSDQLEPWWLELDAAVRSLARATRTAGVMFELAVPLVAERRLISLDLERIGRPGMAALLDERAAAARTGFALSGASAVYLRQLTATGTRQPAPTGDMVLVSIPARLADRLLADPVLSIAPRSGEVDAALRWERAAVARGRTMTEWALAETIAAD
jgi:hypothetical protein